MTTNIPIKPPNYVVEKLAKKLYQHYHYGRKWENLNDKAQQDWRDFIMDAYKIIYSEYKEVRV